MQFSPKLARNAVLVPISVTPLGNRQPGLGVQVGQFRIRRIRQFLSVGSLPRRELPQGDLPREVVTDLIPKLLKKAHGDLTEP